MIRKLRYWKRISLHDAEDAVAAMLLQYVAHARQGGVAEPTKSLIGHLYRLTAEELSDNYRRDKRVPEKRRDWEAREGSAANPFHPTIEFDPDALARREARRTDDPATRAGVRDEFARMRNRLALRLPARDRRILFARAEGLPYEEIARIAATTPGAARVLRVKALGILRRAVGDA